MLQSQINNKLLNQSACKETQIQETHFVKHSIEYTIKLDPQRDKMIGKYFDEE